MSKTLESTITAIAIHRLDESPIYGEMTTAIEISDEAGGPFLIIKNVNPQAGDGEFRIDFDELDMVYDEAKKLIKQYEENTSRANQ